MKKSELQQIIKEEILNILNENRYKEGDKLNYRGINYTVLSDSGYVVNVVDEKGNKAMLNYNQLNQGVFKKPVYEEGNKKYTFEYVHYEYKSTIKVPETVTVTASNEDEARDKAYDKAKKFCEEENVKLKSSKAEFKLK
jgi:nitrogen fixation protein FixH